MELVVIKELLGHAHIGVTATVYAHVRLRLQRHAIGLLGHALRTPADTGIRPTAATNHPSPEPPSADVAVNYCRHPTQTPRQMPSGGASHLPAHTPPKSASGEIYAEFAH
ncbi:hypothetical protein [Streptomyces luteogriseus]|uniref:hypothetical protein n=1 Tax=Streptomyces luteogriseus TaxID=68233 RepID=UPI003AF37F3A